MALEFDNDMDEYILAHSTKEDEVLYELRRRTYLSACNPQMVSGPIQGKLFELLVKLSKPKRVLEIGTFTGYSTICMARGLEGDAQLHTIEVNDEITPLAKEYFIKAKVDHCITLHVGNALEIIATIDETFDFILIDGDKREYPAYLQLILPKLNLGGLLIADNVLWDGKVIDNCANDPHTRSIIEFNKLIADNLTLEKVMLPLRDGLLLVQRVV
jgi:predicted O-methyltransferase YrrM